VNVLETHKIAKKNDTQPKQGEEMLPHFPPKPHLKRKKSENYIQCSNLNQ